MLKIKIILKYVAVYLVFTVAYVVCGGLFYYINQSFMPDTSEIYQALKPFIRAILIGGVGTYCGYEAVERAFSKVNMRFLFWASLAWLVVWVPSITGLLLAIIGVIDADISKHTLMSIENQGMLLHGIINTSILWALTKKD